MNARPVSPVLVGLLVVAFASIFTFLGLTGLYQDYRFSANVERSTATIQQLNRTHNSKGNSTYDVVASFEDKNKESFEESVRVAPETFYHLHKDDRVSIKYLPSQPEQARIEHEGEDDWHWQHDETPLGVGLFFTMVGVIVIWFGRPWKASP